MKKSLIAIVAVLLVGAGMAKRAVVANNGRAQTPAAPQTEQPENGRARSPSAPQTGNLSKLRRDELIGKIGEIKSFLEKSSDTNAVRLLRFAAEVEREVRDKKFGLVFEEHREKIDLMLEENLPVLTEIKKRYLAGKSAKDDSPLNFLIEGDNLAALKLLEKTHRGKIDLIYIDPPYNTGNEDFIYNDVYVDLSDGFRHSKWLSFMEKRLVIAKSLLKTTGAIFISIDDNEYAALRLLCDSVFGEGNFVNNIVVKMSEVSGVKMSHVDKRFPKLKEYCLVYSKDAAQFRLRPILKKKIDEMDSFASYAKYYSKIIVDKSLPVEDWKILPLDEYLSMIDAPFDVKDKNKVLEFKIQNADRMVYRTNNKAFDSINCDKEIALIKSARGLDYIWWEGKQMLFLSDYIKSYEGDLWTDISTINLNKEGYVDFSNGKKPLKLLNRILSTMLVGDATILDFFAGSGTTGHAVMKLNAEDGGKRKFILVTNNENGICEKVTYERLKRVMEKEKYNARLKYMKIGYQDISGKLYYEYADDLLKHIRELVELENAVDFAHDKSIAIVLTQKELDALVSADARLSSCRVVYAGHDVTTTATAKRAFAKYGIEKREIPEYYYPELEK